MVARKVGQFFQQDLGEPVVPASDVPELPADAVDRPMKRLGELLVGQVLDDLESAFVRECVVPDQKAGQRLSRARTHCAPK